MTTSTESRADHANLKRFVPFGWLTAYDHNVPPVQLDKDAGIVYDGLPKIS